MRTGSVVLLALAVAFAPFAAKLSAQVARFERPLRCVFQFGQYLDEAEAKTVANDAPMAWSFGPLTADFAEFESGGTRGTVLVLRHTTGGGASLFVGQGNGAHLFSLWPNGIAYWTKHNAVGQSRAAQQYKGLCTN